MRSNDLMCDLMCESILEGCWDMIDNGTKNHISLNTIVLRLMCWQLLKGESVLEVEIWLIKTVAAPQKAPPSQLESYNALNRELSALLLYKALASKSSLEESVEVQDRGGKWVWDFEEIRFCFNTWFQVIFYIHMFFLFQKQTSAVFFAYHNMCCLISSIFLICATTWCLVYTNWCNPILYGISPICHQNLSSLLGREGVIQNWNR